MKFEDEYHFPNITTHEKAEEYEASHDVFAALLREVKELSKKKPDASMSAGKVKIVNRVLQNLLAVLEGQPDAKYLEALDDDDLPQVSDAVLVMVQFKSALGHGLIMSATRCARMRVGLRRGNCRPVCRIGSPQHGSV